MPKYTYKCSECGHVSTFHHGMRDKVTDCLECGCYNSLQRVVTSISLQREDDQPTHTTGHLVKKTIEETKIEISALKEAMINDTIKD